ncbi:hypothetical protein HN873_021994, partial [Arachis hypogaea]
RILRSCFILLYAPYNVNAIFLNECKFFANLKGLFFVVAKVKEIFGGANWWLFSCVCGHSLDQVDN